MNLDWFKYLFRQFYLKFSELENELWIWNESHLWSLKFKLNRPLEKKFLWLWKFMQYIYYIFCIFKNHLCRIFFHNTMGKSTFREKLFQSYRWVFKWIHNTSTVTGTLYICDDNTVSIRLMTVCVTDVSTTPLCLQFQFVKCWFV